MQSQNTANEQESTSQDFHARPPELLTDATTKTTEKRNQSITKTSTAQRTMCTRRVVFPPCVDATTGIQDRQNQPIRRPTPRKTKRNITLAKGVQFFYPCVRTIATLKPEPTKAAKTNNTTTKKKINAILRVVLPPAFIGGPSVIPFGVGEGRLENGVVQVPLHHTVGDTVDFIRTIATVDRDYRRGAPQRGEEGGPEGASEEDLG